MEGELTRDDVLCFLRDHRSYLEQEFHIEKIGLFGSFARGDNNSASDIDVLVEFPPNTPDIFQIKENLREWLKNNLKRDIDLAREKYLKPRVRDRIIMEAIYA